MVALVGKLCMEIAQNDGLLKVVNKPAAIAKTKSHFGFDDAKAGWLWYRALRQAEKPVTLGEGKRRQPPQKTQECCKPA